MYSRVPNCPPGIVIPDRACQSIFLAQYGPVFISGPDSSIIVDIFETRYEISICIPGLHIGGRS
jgi:hypothetical protein